MKIKRVQEHQKQRVIDQKQQTVLYQLEDWSTGWRMICGYAKTHKFGFKRSKIQCQFNEFMWDFVAIDLVWFQ